jgi:hypothetical protein
MAGDVGFVERIVTPGLEGTLSAEPVLHEYGPRLRIGFGSPEMGLESLEPPLDSASLSGAELIGLNAYELRRSPEYVDAKNRRPRDRENWGYAGPDDVQPLHRNADEAGLISDSLERGAEAPAIPTSERLTGRVAVGLIMVSGSEARLRLSEAERVKIVAEIQNGLSWLGAQSPARDVTWVHEVHSVTVNVPEVTNGTSYEDFEQPWRDAALQQLGLQTGRSGLQAYVQDLRTRLRTDWAYCTLFTRYRLRHFAYADLGGPHLVMHYQNDGWGPDNIDRVFAHETGHIFGAPDEYAAARCNCSGRHGFFRKPNLNCETCAADGGTDCIMRANTWAICPSTPMHLGFNGVVVTS